MVQVKTFLPADDALKDLLVTLDENGDPENSDVLYVLSLPERKGLLAIHFEAKATLKRGKMLHHRAIYGDLIKGICSAVVPILIPFSQTYAGCFVPWHSWWDDSLQPVTLVNTTLNSTNSNKVGPPGTVDVGVVIFSLKKL